MSAKLCKSVLKLLVQEIDKAAFRAEVNFGTVLHAVISENPRVTISEEEWTGLDEAARQEIIDQAMDTLERIGCYAHSEASGM